VWVTNQKGGLGGWEVQNGRDWGLQWRWMCGARAPAKRTNKRRRTFKWHCSHPRLWCTCPRQSYRTTLRHREYRHREVSRRGTGGKARHKEYRYREVSRRGTGGKARPVKHKSGPAPSLTVLVLALAAFSPDVEEHSDADGDAKQHLGGDTSKPSKPTTPSAPAALACVQICAAKPLKKNTKKAAPHPGPTLHMQATRSCH
jgi:hypothetical protein